MNTISSKQSEPKSPDDFAALAVINDDVLEKISGGLVGEGDLNDFPPQLWPVIRTANPEPTPSLVAVAEPDPVPWLVANKLTASIASMANR